MICRPAASGADRSSLPDVGAPPAVAFPQVERRTLSNGLEVVLARRDAIPVVNMQLMVDAGFASDAQAAPGTANLAMNMLDEGTETRTALDISSSHIGSIDALLVRRNHLRALVGACGRSSV